MELQEILEELVNNCFNETGRMVEVEVVLPIEVIQKLSLKFKPHPIGENLDQRISSPLMGKLYLNNGCVVLTPEGK